MLRIGIKKRRRFRAAKGDAPAKANSCDRRTKAEQCTTDSHGRQSNTTTNAGRLTVQALLAPDLRKEMLIRAPMDQWARNAITIFSSVFTGWPSNSVGEYFHSRMALVAAVAKGRGPLMRWTLVTSPLSPTVASSLTISTSLRPIFFGYCGSTRKTRVPSCSRLACCAASGPASRGTSTVA